MKEMTFHLPPFIKVILFGALICSAMPLFAQGDTTAATNQDSILSVQRERSRELLSRMDSIRLADSLALQSLLARIANIKEQDAAEEARLRRQLDSLQNAQELRQSRIRNQVDSLRTTTVGIPVVLYQDTLFYIFSNIGPFSPEERASNIKAKIELLVDEHNFDSSSVEVRNSGESFDVMHGDLILFSITDRDAFWVSSTAESVAERYAGHIKLHITEYVEGRGFWRILYRIGLLILVIIIFYFGIRYLNKGFDRLNAWMLDRSRKYMHGFKFRNYQFISKYREEQIAGLLFRMMKYVSIIFIVYLSLPIVFSIFPATKGIATTLFGYIFNPLKSFGYALVSYIPEMFTILVIILLTHYFVRFLRFLVGEIEDEKLEIPGFYPDWAKPTFNLLKVIIYAFAFVMIFPYLPGSDSEVFKGVSVFFGLLITLGSSTAISNIIAGLVITYMRAFKLGDRVRIGETTGDVIEKTLLITRVRTIKNEDVTIPNSSILNGTTINYSSTAKSLGLILNSTVTIGYDVPWPKVHELLTRAAANTEYIKADPKPFVLQTSLDDFYVSYQINAYTDEEHKAAKIYSDLHANIQDSFRDGGVEIMSPHYRATRDGSEITIPPGYVPNHGNNTGKQD